MPIDTVRQKMIKYLVRYNRGELMKNTKILAIFLSVALVCGVVFATGCGELVATSASASVQTTGTATSAASATSTAPPTVAPTSNIGSVKVINGTRYVQTFADEFSGIGLDTTYWTIEQGTGSQYGLDSWGNNEQQYYTNESIDVYDGKLAITATKEKKASKNYTSGRIYSSDKFSQTYGRFEARMKLPEGQGMWPAFWMQPQDTYYGGWPRSGEIDIMEAKGRLTYKTSGALHYTTTGGSHTYDSRETNISGFDLTDYHVYAVEWSEDKIDWYVDNVLFMSKASSSWQTSAALGDSNAPFDKDFYLILNLAVGGNFDGNRLPGSDFEYATLFVDYVRVYQYEGIYNAANPSATATATATANASSSAAATAGYYWSQTLGEEFSGTSLDSTLWTAEYGTGSQYGIEGWGNNEQQYYQASNATVSGGTLKIAAKAETVGDKSYTSARIKTDDKFSQTCGKFEAKIKLPAGQGLWPAFWLLPDDDYYGSWPFSGEIDIMEANGGAAGKTSGALHYTTTNGVHTYQSRDTSISGFDLTGWHVYSIEWSPTSIKWYVDNNLFMSMTSSQWQTSRAASDNDAPFDKDFYIILNLAVGGQYINHVLPASSFVQAVMEVDYVRVYELKAGTAPSSGATATATASATASATSSATATASASSSSNYAQGLIDSGYIPVTKTAGTTYSKTGGGSVQSVALTSITDNKNYVLMENINLGNRTGTVIASLSAGVLDGNGKTVTLNSTINLSGRGALIQQLTNGSVVRNLCLKGTMKLTNNCNSVGYLVGYIHSSCVIENVYVSVTLSGEGSSNVGSAIAFEVASGATLRYAVANVTSTLSNSAAIAYAGTASTDVLAVVPVESNGYVTRKPTGTYTTLSALKSAAVYSGWSNNFSAAWDWATVLS